MTHYDETLEAVRLASLEIGDGEFHAEEPNPYRAIKAGRAAGYVKVFTDRANNGHAVVSLEIDGMSQEQAVAVLHVLSRRTNAR